MIRVKKEPVDDEFSFQTLTTEASSPANQDVEQEPVDDVFSSLPLTTPASPANQDVKQKPSSLSIYLSESAEELQDDPVMFVVPVTEGTQLCVFEGTLCSVY